MSDLARFEAAVSRHLEHLVEHRHPAIEGDQFEQAAAVTAYLACAATIHLAAVGASSEPGDVKSAVDGLRSRLTAIGDAALMESQCQMMLGLGEA